MARRTTKETPEQVVTRWLAGAATGVSYDQVMAAGWEAGQVSHVTLDGVHYERFFLAADCYVVVSWDGGGNVCVN